MTGQHLFTLQLKEEILTVYGHFLVVVTITILLSWKISHFLRRAAIMSLFVLFWGKIDLLFAGSS